MKAGSVRVQVLRLMRLFLSRFFFSSFFFHILAVWRGGDAPDIAFLVRYARAERVLFVPFD